MPKDRRIVVNALNNSSALTTEDKKMKLTQAEEKVELVKSASSKVIHKKSLMPHVILKRPTNANEHNVIGSQSSMATPSSTNQIASSKDALQNRSTSKKRKAKTTVRESKRVKFSDATTPSSTLTKHKKVPDKKKVAMRPRSNSLVVGTSSQNSKLKSGVVGTKRKLKAKKQRAITNAMPTVIKQQTPLKSILTPTLTPIPTPTTTSIKKPVERILTRSPLENALANVAANMNLSDEDLRVTGGSSAAHISAAPPVRYYSQIGNLPNVKKIAGGEEPKKTPQRSTPVVNSNNTTTATAGSSSTTAGGRAKPKSDVSGTNAAASSGDEDPNKKKNNKDGGGGGNANNNGKSADSSGSDGKRKRKLTEENSAKVSNDTNANAAPGTSAQSAEDEQDKEEEEDKDAKKKKNRCAECRKKVGLTGFQCRCGGLYCAVHRYSDKHNCTFNYREHGAQEIRRNNPVVVGEKIQKI